MDYAAATPVSEHVLEAMQPFYKDIFYNPSALYKGAKEASNYLEEARSLTAKTIGARPSEIIFTAGGTESANLAVTGVLSRYKGAEVLVSAIEHDAVLKPAQKGMLKTIDVHESGRINLDSLVSQINDNTALVSVMLVNNEIGVIQDISKITEIFKKIRLDRAKRGIKQPIFLHTDACQAPLYIDVNVARLGVDMMTLNGGKIFGPKQSGMLYVRAGVVIDPIILGGGQESNLRSGTENVAFAVGFSKALEHAQKGRATRSKDVSKVRDYFIEKLECELDAILNGDKKHRIASNVHVTFIDSDNERVLFSLDDLGVDAAAGSACSASNDTSSHVLLALGKTDKYARSSVRFTIGPATTLKEVDKVIEALKIAVKA